MRKYVLFAFTVCLLYLSSPLQGYAQTTSIDSTSQNIKLKKAVGLYDKATGETGSFYNGQEYQFFPHAIKGNPYYIAQDGKDGELLYNHVNYYNIHLMYDVVRGLIVPLTFNDQFMFSLISDKVAAFSISNHNFKRIIADTTNSTLETGFYEILYAGKTEVLLKRATDIQSGTPPEKFFKEHFYYYIKHDKSYYRVSSKGSVLSVLKDKKAELQQRSKKTDISFGDRKGEAIVLLASYYDETTK